MKKFISAVIAVIVIGSFAVCAQARSLGDVDSNGQVNSSDALTILKYAVGMIDDANKKLADVDLNGTVNSSDALIVLKTAVGMYDEIKDIEKPVCMSSIIEPVVKTGNYSMKMGSIAYNSEEVVVKGKDAADIIETKWFKEIALFKDGKSYYILPEHKIYSEVPEVTNISDNVNSYFTNLTFVGTTIGTIKQKTYRCEVFTNSSENICKFYFNGNILEYITVTDKTGTSSILAAQVLSFSGETDNSVFSFDGYKKMDIDAFEDYMVNLMK